MAIRDDMYTIVDKASHYTDSVLSEIHKCLVPIDLDIDFTIKQNHTYKYKEDTYTNYDKMVVAVGNIRSKPYEINTKSDIMFHDNMIDLYKAGKITPFMLFVDGLHIRWSRITVVRDARYNYLLIDPPDGMTGEEFRTYSRMISMVILPFNVLYTERRERHDDYTPIAVFDLNGDLRDTGKVMYYTNNPYLHYKEYTYLNGNLKGEDIEIDHKIKLGSSNFLVFKNRLYDYDASISVSNINTISMNGGVGQYRVKLFYRDDINPAQNNMSDFTNVDYIKEIIKSDTMNVSNVDAVLFEKPFDFSFDPKKTFDQNLDDSYSFLTSYNSKFLKLIYEMNSRVETITKTGAEVRSMCNIFGMIHMLRLKYKEKENYVMVFCNGELYKHYSDATYTLDEFHMPIDTVELKDNDIFEFVFFKRVNNYHEWIHYTEENKFKEQRAFENDELLLYSKDPLDHEYPEMNRNPWRSIYKVEFSIDENDNVILDDERYVDTDLLYTTKNQFRYCFRNIMVEGVKIRLTPDFVSCLNPKQYMVFYNGRLMNSWYYRLIFEDRDNTFTDPYIYSRIKLHPGDKLEVFYVPMELNELEYGADQTTSLYNVTASQERQTDFVIPYPFKTYTTRNEFIVFIGNMYVDKERYIIEDEMIKFIDGTYIPQGKVITFLFIYNKSDTKDNIQYITDVNSIKSESNYISIEEDGQTLFMLPEKYMDILAQGNSVMVTYKGLYISPSYYTVDPYSASITFVKNKFKAGDFINVIVLYSNSVVETIDGYVEVTYDGINTFNIPDQLHEYISQNKKLLVMMNNTLLTEGAHYNIARSTKRITFNKPTTKGQRIHFLGFQSDNSIVKVYENSIYIEDPEQLDYDMSGMFTGITDGINKFMIFMGSLLMDPRRYTFDDGTLTLHFNDNRGLIKGRTLKIVALYNASKFDSENTYNYLGSARYTNIKQVNVPIDHDNDTYDIPYPVSSDDTDTFFIMIGGVLFDETRYTINQLDNTITLNEGERLKLKTQDVMTFIFIYDEMYDIDIEIDNSVISRAYKRTYNIPVPFSNYFKLNNKLLVFMGSTLMDSNRYTIDEDNNTITFLENEIIESGYVIKFIFIYNSTFKNIVVTNDEVTIANIKHNGYIFMNRNKLNNVPLGKKLFFMFLNGRKVALQDIIDVSSNIVKINKDYQSRYNLLMLNYTDKYEELDPFSMYSDYDTIVNNLDVSDLNSLFNSHIRINDTEPHHEMDVTKEAIINEVIRDWYAANNIYNGEVFKYTYDDNTQTTQDGDESFLMPLDADEFFAVNLDRSNTNEPEE